MKNLEEVVLKKQIYFLFASKMYIVELFTRHSRLSWSLGSKEWRWTDEKWSSHWFNFPD